MSGGQATFNLIILLTANSSLMGFSSCVNAVGGRKMNFREEREKIGISQKEFAELIGVSPAAVCQWEAGKTLPRGKTARLLSLIFRSQDEQDTVIPGSDISPCENYVFDPDEEWRSIQDFPGYSVSSKGRVRSDKYNKILHTFINNKGYERVALTIEHITKRYLVHRLVAMAFIENPMNYPMINHKDENKTNNNVSNLE